MKNLKNKTAIITGGSKGIGKGIVEKFAKNGCNVAFTYLSSESSAKEVALDLVEFAVICVILVFITWPNEEIDPEPFKFKLSTVNVPIILLLHKL